MICSECDLENPESAKFCKKCGKRLELTDKNSEEISENREKYTPHSRDQLTIYREADTQQNQKNEEQEKNKNNLRKRFFAYFIDYFFVMGLFEFINSWVIIRYGPRFIFSTLNLMFFIYFLIAEFKYKNTIGKTFINVITIGKDSNTKPSSIVTVLLSLIKSVPLLLFFDVFFGFFINRRDGKFIRVSEKVLKVSC